MKRGAKVKPVLELQVLEGETEKQASARCALTPATGGGAFMFDLHSNFLAADPTQFVAEMQKQADAVKGGSLARLEEMLTVQAHVLDGLFYSMLNRSRANASAGYADAAETYMKLGLRAQSQCRATAESIAAIKNPSTVAFIRQANVTTGPQQVNNGVAPPLPSARTEEIENTPTKLLEAIHGERLDSGAARTASSRHTEMETVGALDRSQDGKG